MASTSTQLSLSSMLVAEEVTPWDLEMESHTKSREGMRPPLHVLG